MIQLSADSSSCDSSSSESDPHLDDKLLKDYALGKLTEQAIQKVEQHLISCEECAVRFDAMEAGAATSGFSEHVKSLLSGRSVADTVSGDDDGVDLVPVVSWGSASLGTDQQPARFRKQKIIGRGGMGEIWQAYDSLVKRQVALKQLRQDKSYSPKHLARFKREVLLTAKLTHPGTVFVIDYSDEPGNAYYVMNLVHGRTLTSMIADYHRKRVAGTPEFSGFITLIRAFISVCNTIAYAHSHGVLHRDIKSENVMVGKFGEVTLLDWGLAKSFDVKDHSLASSELPIREMEQDKAPVSVRTTIEGQSLGTPAFMAPEQAIGALEKIDVRTDTYMLSGMLYEILAGCPPFDKDDVDAVIEMVIHKSPPLASERVPESPAALVQICNKGLSKDRDSRFQTTVDLIDRVQVWLSGRADREKADEFFKRCFELAFDAMGIVDFRRGLQNLNSAWRFMFGWDPNEITGRTHYEMIHPDDQVAAARALSRANRSKEPQQVTVRLLCKDGHYQRSVWNLAPYVEEASVLIIGRRLD
jgi:PAS domain S-box-containing protein